MSADEHLGLQFHGSADVYSPGDVIDPSKPHKSINMGRSDRVYFTPHADVARSWAGYAAEEKNWNGKFGPEMSTEGPHTPHVYEVTPLGKSKQDDRSHRGLMSKHPIRVEREV